MIQAPYLTDFPNINFLYETSNEFMKYALSAPSILVQLSLRRMLYIHVIKGASHGSFRGNAAHVACCIFVI